MNKKYGNIVNEKMESFTKNETFGIMKKLKLENHWRRRTIDGPW